MMHPELELLAGRGPAPIVIDPPSQAFMQLKGVAASRGEFRKPADMIQARRHVADLTRDPDLLEQLAAEALQWSPRGPSREG